MADIDIEIACRRRRDPRTPRCSFSPASNGIEYVWRHGRVENWPNLITNALYSPDLESSLPPPSGVRNRVLSKIDFFRALNRNFVPWARSSKIPFISLCLRLMSHKINLISHKSNTRRRLRDYRSTLSARSYE